MQGDRVTSNSYLKTGSTSFKVLKINLFVNQTNQEAKKTHFLHLLFCCCYLCCYFSSTPLCSPFNFSSFCHTWKDSYIIWRKSPAHITDLSRATPTQTSHSLNVTDPSIMHIIESGLVNRGHLSPYFDSSCFKQLQSLFHDLFFTLHN